MLFDDKGKMLGREEFRELAASHVKIYNETWFNVEYESATANIVSGNKWREMYKDRDLYPYWRYVTAEDTRVRPEHAALDGLIFKIGDPNGDRVYPKCSWNCRCGGRNIDRLDVKESGKDVLTTDEAEKYLTGDDPKTGKPYVDPQFRFNPGITGALPNTGSYFEVLKNANKGQYKLFSE